MRSGIGLLALASVVAACGGKVRSDAAHRTEGSGGTGEVAGGATAGSATAGSAGTATCPGVPVTFRIVPAPSSATEWCMGTPGGCTLGLELSDAAGPLRLSNLCSVDCESCEPTVCPPLVCLSPEVLGPEGLVRTWDGGRITESTCGDLAETCARSDCAAAGRYTIEICGFPNPSLDPDFPCASASATPETCLTVDFTYPAPEPIVVTMPDP